MIEAGQLLAGPFAATLMADQGADVIKVEAPGTGDPMRQWGRDRRHAPCGGRSSAATSAR